MRLIPLVSLWLFAATASAIDVDIVRQMPNPSFHNSSFGAAETSNGGTTTYYTTTGDKQVYVGAGLLKRLINATGTTITVSVWDDADGTCSSAQRTGVITLTNGTPVELGIEVSSGLCLTVAGTSPTLTVISQP